MRASSELIASLAEQNTQLVARLELLARRLASGNALPIGAHTSTSLLTLESFAPEFAKWGMVTDIVEEP